MIRRLCAACNEYHIYSIDQNSFPFILGKMSFISNRVCEEANVAISIEMIIDTCQSNAAHNMRQYCAAHFTSFEQCSDLLCWNALFWPAPLIKCFELHGSACNGDYFAGILCAIYRLHWNERGPIYGESVISAMRNCLAVRSTLRETKWIRLLFVEFVFELWKQFHQPIDWISKLAVADLTNMRQFVSKKTFFEYHS